MQARSNSKNIVILVDNKRRDLMVAALLAHHLEPKGIQCHLEPLQAWQGALAAHQPDLILFNHLTAAHLVKYSRRLAEMGVLTAVLPNEGILYDLDVLAFNAGKHHNGAHIDLFFCWNEVHKAALQKCGFIQTQIEVVGVPRFDFYFPPWSEICREPHPASSGRPRILFCTNFAFAKFRDMAAAHTERFFGRWKDAIPSYLNYRELIETNHASRDQMFGFLDAVVRSGKFDVTLRPHPSENATVYQKWHESLPDGQKATVRLDGETNITSLILSCDLEISCETCTTALESWIARKPTIELLLQQHPIFYHADIAAMTATCADPNELTPLIERQLSAPIPASWETARRQHLQKWCHAPNGASSLKLAQAIADRLEKRPAPDWSKLGPEDRRRGLKLKLTNKLGQAYHFDPLLPVKSLFRKARYARKVFTYGKAIKPRDVRQARAALELGLRQS